MDRSFLSQPQVIAASRQFVCVRLATYEDADEAAFLKALVHTRSGELENSVFAILSPDGKQNLVRAVRSMRHVYADAQAMAEGMTQIANRLLARAEISALPLADNVRLAVDVAAADNQPLVIVAAKDEAFRADVERQVARLAWNNEFIGRFVYAAAASTAEMTMIDGVDPAANVLVVQSNKYGLKGTVLGQVAGDVSSDSLATTLRSALAKFDNKEKTFQNHVREGQRQGMFWETKIPVTDPMELNARERGRRR